MEEKLVYEIEKEEHCLIRNVCLFSGNPAIQENFCDNRNSEQCPVKLYPITKQLIKT